MTEIGSIFLLLYAWIKAAHLIFVIFWIAGLFLLPRYYVYHQESPIGSDEEKRWIDREAKLRGIILNPAMILVWVLGLILVWLTGAWTQGWFHAKFTLVVALSGYHGWMIGYGRKLAQGQRTMSARTLRLANEVPAIATAIIVILVIVKPF